VDSDLLRGHKKSNETRLLIVAFDSLGYQESDLSQTHTHTETHIQFFILLRVAL